MERGEEFSSGLKEQEKAEQDMPMPGVSVAYERGPAVFSLMDEVLQQDVEAPAGHAIAGRVQDSLALKPVTDEFRKELKSVYEDYDSETRLRLSFALGHPERMEEIRRGLLADKPELAGREAGFEWFIHLLQEFAQRYGDLERDVRQLAEQDIKQRMEALPELTQRLVEAKEFFNPARGSASVEHVVVLPTDPLQSEKSGVNVEIGPTTYISSHRDNIDNQTHEFLHSLVNPMVARLNLSDQQKRNVTDLTSRRLRVEQEYGDDFFPLLCETFIRTYVDRFSKRDPVPMMDSFGERVQSVTEEEFKQGMDDERERQRFESIDIHSLEQFKDGGWKTYFERFISDPLGERVYTLYTRYAETKQLAPGTRFEDFLKRHIGELLPE